MQFHQSGNPSKSLFSEMNSHLLDIFIREAMQEKEIRAIKEANKNQNIVKKPIREMKNIIHLFGVKVLSVSYDGRRTKIAFKHPKYAGGNKFTKFKDKEGMYSYFEEGKMSKTKYAEVYCHEDDKFDKETGYYLAVVKAQKIFSEYLVREVYKSLK